MLTHFFLHYSIVVTLIGIFLVAYQFRINGFLLIILAGILLFPYQNYYGSLFEEFTPGERRIKVSFLNTRSSVQAVEKYTQRAIDRNIDIITFAQVTPEAKNVIEQEMPAGWNIRFKLFPGAFGIGLITNYPIADFDYFHEIARNVPYGAKNPWVRADLNIGNRKVKVGIFHPPRPTSRSMFKVRNNMFSYMTNSEHTNSLPDLLIGDFNASPASPYFRKLVKRSYWKDANHASPFRATWPTGIPLLGIPIDHLLYGPEFDDAYSEVGPSFGSDHASLFGELSMR